MSELRTEPGGSLAVHADGFVAWLVGRGYRLRSVRVQLRLLADLDGWLAGEGREPAALGSDDVVRFLGCRRARVVDLTGARALGPLLAYLRELGVVPQQLCSAGTPVEGLLADYREYLERERGLTAVTVDGLERVARLFCSSVPSHWRKRCGG